MPGSVNGVGTSLIKASKPPGKRCEGQFDAIEAVVLFFCPLIAYKAVHILSMQRDAKDFHQDHYHAIPLRFAPRIVAKGYLNAWGNNLSIFGGCAAIFFGVASFNMPREFNQRDLAFILAFALACLLGLLLKTGWLILEARDKRIREILGPHDFGRSDPYYWNEEIADPVREHLLSSSPGASLSAIAEQALAAGDQSKAMLCARLAMRTGEHALQAQMVFDRLLHG